MTILRDRLGLVTAELVLMVTVLIGLGRVELSTAAPALIMSTTTVSPMGRLRRTPGSGGQTD
jgi:hypothetical protein